MPDARRAATINLIERGNDPGRLLVRFPYDEGVVLAIKELGRVRRWDPGLRAWLVPRRYLKELFSILAGRFGDAVILYPPLPALVGVTDCPTHGRFRGLGQCPRCNSAVKHRIGRSSRGRTVSCNEQCYLATGDECNCVCLYACHGAGGCTGDHDPSNWQRARLGA